MSFWKVDLTTEDGAANATSVGGMACFIAAGLTALGAVFLAGLGAAVVGDRTVLLASAALSIVVFLAAGWRLRGGRGAFWGIAAALLLLLEIISKLIAFTGFVGLVINVILLIVIVNGVRGAWQLRRGFPEDAAEVFE